MKIERGHVNGWAQSTLLPPESIRIEVTARLDAGCDTAQIGISITDGKDETQLGLSTWTIDNGRDGSGIVASVAEAVSAALAEWWFPF